MAWADRRVNEHLAEQVSENVGRASAGFELYFGWSPGAWAGGPSARGCGSAGGGGRPGQACERRRTPAGPPDPMDDG
eukprot:4804047-Alexandrium_andersonii.AAC.1